MRWVVPVPERKNVNTERSFALVDSGTTAPLARAGSPPWKLIVEMVGSVAPDGNTRRWPREAGPTTVTFRLAAFAPTGTPHLPCTWKSRVVLALRAGPSPALRVS